MRGQPQACLLTAVLGRQARQDRVRDVSQDRIFLLPLHGGRGGSRHARTPGARAARAAAATKPVFYCCLIDEHDRSMAKFKWSSEAVKR
jgi:hypothetical protein